MENMVGLAPLSTERTPETARGVGAMAAAYAPAGPSFDDDPETAGGVVKSASEILRSVPGGTGALSRAGGEIGADAGAELCGDACTTPGREAGAILGGLGGLGVAAKTGGALDAADAAATTVTDGLGRVDPETVTDIAVGAGARLAGWFADRLGGGAEEREGVGGGLVSTLKQKVTAEGRGGGRSEAGLSQ